LETGVVPPVANFKEIDPELGTLNLSKGGSYPVEYALRLGAGFGSQISMSLLRWVPTKDGARRSPNTLGYEYRIADTGAWKQWLTRITGKSSAALEIVARTLRVREQAHAPAPAPEPSSARPHGPAAIPAVPSRAPEKQTAVAPIPVAPQPPKAAAMAAGVGVSIGLSATSSTMPVKRAPVVAGSVVEQKSAPTKEVVSPKPQMPAIAPVTVAPPTRPDGETLVRERILALVVEKTGYPKEMLDLDLDLEADLGVDTVKQAEMFAAIREMYGIPRDENRKLRDYPTLAHVIRFVYEKRPDLAVAGSTPPSAEAQPRPASIQTGVTEPAETQPAAAQHAVTAEQPSEDPIKERILDLVVEKTGYPKEMLDLGLDLEADLGIDTVKQAEMFAAIRAAYNIPRDENLKLRDFPTLAHVIQFARDRSELGAPESVAQPTADRAAPRASTPPAVPAIAKRTPRPALASLDAANSIPRRVPVPVLRPPLAICKPTGVTFDVARRVIVATDASGVGDVLARALEEKGVEVLHIEAKTGSQDLVAHVQHWIAEEPVHGIYWLPALDIEPRINEMNAATWHEAVRVRVKSLYSVVRALYEEIAATGTFLISATRLGGQHGYDDSGAIAPLGGAVTGFTKAYKRERPDALVKAVDFEVAAQPGEIAEVLISEALRDPGAVEIGYKSGLRWTIGLQEQSANDGQSGLILDEKTVFVITGAAGSIVSAITRDLAAASGGTFYLLDVVPEPDPKNTDLKRFAEDKESLKRDLFARIQARGERATPALVEKELAALERAEAARAAIDAVRASGGTVHYFSVDMRDAKAVVNAIDKVRKTSGRIDVLLHAAGVDRSRSLAQKEPAEFDLVFDVKSDGLFNLLHAIGDMPLGVVVAFSSIAGRFGNAGQTDYSAANDLLCKIVSNSRATRPNTRAIAIDWTAWGGIGMATRGSIPKVMEMAGIDMLPPEVGVPLIRRELTAGGTRGEIVIGQRLGVLLTEQDEAGGIDPVLAHFSQGVLSKARGPIAEKIVRTGVFTPLTVETRLDPKVQPFLYDHQIDGAPVLPGVMGLEAFAEAALYTLPGWHVEAMENVDFLAPFKFYRKEPRTVTVETTIRPQTNGLIADCRLIGRRLLPTQQEAQSTTHFSGRVQLTKQMADAAAALQFALPTGNDVEAADIYRLYFHGPAYQVIERAWWNGTELVALMASDLPANHHPSELPTAISPRLVELCFQAAGIWEMGVQERMGLPLHIERVCFFRSPETAEGRLYAVITPNAAKGSFDAEVVDEAGKRYVQLGGYRTVALPNAIDAERLKPLRALFAMAAVGVG
jgi:NAD(P)-dependent dehydrogenase (short-subunit alcohol dehydrogenase family)/acyl carrier protein